MQFLEVEAKDAVRMSWNVWPSSKLEAAKMIVPLAAMYTPLKPVPTTQQPLPYDPIACKGANCQCILNPYW